MKHFLVLVLIIQFTQLSFSQCKYPRVEKIMVKDRVFHGQIDKYPITIYLKFNQYSNCSSAIYSVDGWYYYDKHKIKIPLVGLYTYPNLTLYNFKEIDSIKRNGLLNFKEVKDNYWIDIEYYANLKNYKEKFILSGNESYWQNENKKLKVSLNSDNIKILTSHEFLLLDSKTVFNLHNFGNWTWNFELVAYKSQSQKFILEYDYFSNSNIMGMCGAGNEKGFFIIEFDKHNQLISYEKFVYESCLNGIYSEKENTQNKTIFYKCYSEENDKSYELKINLKDVTIEMK